MTQAGETMRAGRHDSFIGDVAAALRCWKADPRLPLLTLALLLATITPAFLQRLSPGLGASAIVVWPVSLFLVGFNGAQRVWYRRLFDGQTITLGEVWTVSWQMLGRFLALGLLTFWPVMLAGIPWLVMFMTRALAATTEYLRTHPYQYGAPRPTAADLHIGPVYDGWFALAVVATLLWDFALTFATPALSFTTTRAREAFRIGLRMIRRTWPAAALYVFFPPLALQALSLGATAGGIRISPLVYLFSAVTTMLNLVAKGAVVAFYLRNADGVATAPPLASTPGASVDSGPAEPPADR